MKASTLTTKEKKMRGYLVAPVKLLLRFQFFFLTALLRNTRKRTRVKSAFNTNKVKCSKNKTDER